MIINYKNPDCCSSLNLLFRCHCHKMRCHHLRDTHRTTCPIRAICWYWLVAWIVRYPCTHPDPWKWSWPRSSRGHKRLEWSGLHALMKHLWESCRNLCILHVNNSEKEKQWKYLLNKIRKKNGQNGQTWTLWKSWTNEGEWTELDKIDEKITNGHNWTQWAILDNGHYG